MCWVERNISLYVSSVWCVCVCVTEVRGGGSCGWRGWEGVIILWLSPSDQCWWRWHHPTKMRASDRVEYSYLSKWNSHCLCNRKTYDGMQKVREEKCTVRAREKREEKVLMHRRHMGGENGRMWKRKRLNSSHTSGQDGRLDRAWQVPEQ